MKTARQVAHDVLGIVACPTVTPSADCDRVTAAIEARDAEHLERARAMVERMAENSGRALKNARSAALEEAAKLCDDTAEMECSTTAALLADGIRALASTTPAPEGGR